ncbi:MAG: hypothetical protein NTV06_03620 [candidate division Zixibacteria bacterium]|nr:hypothetical protein [candidate division Zixibacteria bacterium]
MTGIITIFDHEIKVIKDYSQVEDIKKLAHQKYYCGRLNEQDIVFTLGENNPLQLALLTQIMIDNFHIERILFTGQVTPLVPYIKTGDIIIANYFIQPGSDANHMTQAYESDPKLLKMLKDAGDAPHREGRAHTFGTIIQSERPDIEHPRIRAAQQEFGALGIDNGGVAVVYTCHLNDIPFAAIEIVEDKSQSEAKDNLNLMETALKEGFEIKGLILASLATPALV